jgi:hypothetical protein
MAIRISDLPPELRRQLLDQTAPAPVARRPRRKAPPRSGLMRVCSCRCEIFRPDGIYPEACDGCGQKWPPEAR